MENKVVKEISLKINDNMTDIEKYRVIYDYIVDNVNYDYGTLYNSVAHACLSTISREVYKSGLIKEYAARIDNYSKLSGYERMTRLLNYIINGKRRNNLIEELKKNKVEYENNNMITMASVANRRIEQATNDDLLKKAIFLIEKAKLYFKKKDNYYKNNNIPKGDMFESGYGVCRNFSDNFKDLCGKFNLPCEIVIGQILSNGNMLSHEWNAIVVDNEIKFVDISGAIHSKDGTYKNTSIDDYINKSYDELLEVDNGKNRTINDESMNNISLLLPNNKTLKRIK